MWQLYLSVDHHTANTERKYTELVKQSSCLAFQYFVSQTGQQQVLWNNTQSGHQNLLIWESYL